VFFAIWHHQLWRDNWRHSSYHIHITSH